MMLYSFAAVLADGIARYLTIDGFPSTQILFVRCAVGSLILLPIVLKDKSVFVSRKTLRLYLIRGILTFSSVASWLYLLKYADFTAMIAIGFLAPLLTSVLAIVFLGEEYTRLKTAALLIGFSGTLIIIEPFNINFNIYLVFAILSTFFWSVSLIMVKRLSTDQKPMTVAFFLAAVMAPLSFVVALPTWQWPTQSEWFYILVFTLLATITQFSLTKAFSKTDVTVLMPIGYIELVFAAIFSYIVFENLVAINTLIGGAIVLGGGYIIVRNEHKKKHCKEDLEMPPQ